MSHRFPPYGKIRTVLGDIEPSALGHTNYHEHLFQVSPLLLGDELDDENKSSDEAARLKASGFDTMVDATPLGLGRRPEAIARISAFQKITVVATTGRHRQEHYQADHWVRRLDETGLADLLVSDLTEGMSAPGENGSPASALSPDGRPIRAGVLKAGIGYWRISAFEEETLNGLASAHQLTGAPVMIHLEFGSAGHEVLNVLESQGVDCSSVVLAHMDRNLDSGLHASLIERGAYLGYDGMARAKSHSDQALLEHTRNVVERAGGAHILIGGDVARASRYWAYGGMPGLQYLAERYLPRLRQEIGPEALSHILVDNPARWLTWKKAR